MTSPDAMTGVGRPDTAVLTADKWQLLNALTEVAPRYGLNHRALGVLKALMTFLPDRQIGAEAVVFPANRTLSARLNGMPESTLRRHLAALVASGLVSRRDSPNRKRYARRIGGAGGIAFGFDLAPLARAAGAIAQALERTRREAEEHAALRARLLELCHAASDTEEIRDARKALRRKSNSPELALWIERLTPVETPEPETEKMSASDSQTERHLQESGKIDSVERRMPLEKIRDHCKAAESFYPGEIRSWPDLKRVAQRIGPMIGIEAAVLRDAEMKMGQGSAALTVLSMLERLTTIRNPGGYLRRLSQLAALGRFDAADLVNSPGNCQLTT